MKHLGSILTSVIVTVGFFVALWLFVYLRMHPPERLDAGIDAILNIMVGALGAGFTTVVVYWLGSSAGSKAKDDILRDRLNENVPPRVD